MLGFTPLSQTPFSAPQVAANVVDAAASTSASSSTSVAYLRVRLADANPQASSSSTITATRARNIDGAAMSSTSTLSSGCERVRQDNQAVSTTSTTAINIERVRQDNQLVTGTSTTVSLSTYSRIRTGGSESMSSTATFTAPRPYRTRLIAVEAAGDSSVVTLYERWRLIERIVVSGNATITGDVDRVRLCSAATSADSTVTAAAGRTTGSGALVSAESSISAVAGRTTESGADIVEGVSVVVAIGREKWEPIVDNDVEGFWVERSYDSSGTDFWTEVA